MLSVYISADIEGVNSVVYPHQTEASGGDSYFLARKQQVCELNQIIEALLEARVYKITVNDAHGSMDNVCISELNPKVELITGKPKPISMLAGLDDSYSCVFLVGYHVRAGSEAGVLAHTFSTIFKQVRLNGSPIGEIELNAVYAGLLNVPVTLVTGDDITCTEAVEVIGKVNTVATKTAISTTSARCKPNEELLKELRLAVFDAIKNQPKWSAYKKNPPYTLELELIHRRMADWAELLPNIERISATEIKFSSNNYQDVYKLMQFLSATLSNI